MNTPAQAELGRGFHFERTRTLGNIPIFSLRRPLRSDLYRPLCARQIVAEAAPGPVFWLVHQSTGHRVAMNIAQLLHEFLLAPHIEVVIPRLPERILRA